MTRGHCTTDEETANLIYLLSRNFNKINQIVIYLAQSPLPNEWELIQNWHRFVNWIIQRISIGLGNGLGPKPMLKN